MKDFKEHTSWNAKGHVMRKVDCHFKAVFSVDRMSFC